MKKEDLKFGNVVEIKDGVKYLYHGQDKNKFLNLETGDSYVDLSDYDDDLTNPEWSDGDYDIVKVYKNYTCKKVLWERKEKSVLTEEEISKLKVLKELGNKYIARDENNKLYVYTEKPKKYAGFWDSENFHEFYFNHLFQFIKWKDKEPYSIEDLLNE